MVFIYLKMRITEVAHTHRDRNRIAASNLVYLVVVTYVLLLVEGLYIRTIHRENAQNLGTTIQLPLKVTRYFRGLCVI